MGVLKCTVCGGELEINSDMSVGVCKYCDSTITIPKELDRKGNLYNRAVFLRQNNQFDKAIAVYEDILKEDNTDADAHWGLVLSKYGIEYVTDPVTKEHIPTCHRTQEESILTDSDYRAAVEYSHFEAGRVIEQEAKRISEIQQRILNISRNEPAYDVFICYKETDDYGNRTEDSVLAQDLYYELTKKGYKVFFAKKTLENKLGSEYEPIIYAALNSAKVMIVLGTKAEYFDAVWVKNEWSRFLRMSREQEKTIIPAYRGISAYDLPAELSGFQAQDMSRIGFMQDLTDGIARCIRGSQTQSNVGKNTSVNIATGMSLERLLKNGETYISLNNFDVAKKTYAKATEEYPEDYRSWWGLIVATTEDFHFIPSIAEKEDELTLWYSYVKKLAKPENMDELERKYVEFLQRKAKIVTKDEMEKVNQIIKQYEKQIEIERKKISDINTEISHKNINLKNDEERMQEQINEKKEELSDVRAVINEIELRKTIGWILVAISFICWFAAATINGMVDLMWGWLVMLVGGILFIKSANKVGKVQHKENEIKRIKESIESLSQTSKQNKTRIENERQCLKSDELNHQKEISVIQSKIEQCDKYLAYGTDIISENLLALECMKIGKEKSYNEEVMVLRDLILSQSLNSDKVVNVTNVTLDIPCFACKTVNNVSETMIRNNKNSFVCKSCGKLIHVKLRE